MKHAQAAHLNGYSPSYDARPAPTALPRVAIPSDDPTYQAVLRACCPAVYFHPDESYFPISVEAFLKAMQIMRRGQRVADATPAALARYTDASYYLDWNDAADFVTRVKPGRALDDETCCTAPVYTHVAEKDGMLYLTYAFFYAYNGPLSFFTRLHRPHRMQPQEKYWSFSWPHFGEHVADWEHVTVQVDREKQVITRVFFSAPGGGWHAAETLRFEDASHIVVQAALNTHASYPAPADEADVQGSHYLLHDLSAEALALANTLEFIWSGGAYFFKTIQTVNVTGRGAQTWRPWTVEGGLVALDAQPWLAFQGCWSPDLLVGFDGLGITRDMIDLLNATGARLPRAVWMPLAAPTPSPVGYAHEVLNEVASTPRFLAALPLDLLYTPGPCGPRHQGWLTAPKPAGSLPQHAAPPSQYSGGPLA